MSNNTISLNLNHGFEIFLGFLYSVLLGVVIQTAYNNSGFSSIVHIILTFLLVLFFAYDWLSKTQSFLKMPEKMLSKTILKNLLKIFLDLVVVFSLLVFSLKFVEVYSLPTSDNYLFYAMTMFAIFSGLWNTLLITIFTGINKPHVINFFKGHLQQDIIEMFPDLIKKWRNEIESRVEQIHSEMDELRKNSPFESIDQRKEFRRRFRELDKNLGLKLYYKCLTWKPYRLILPYFFVFHVVVLNLILGFFIWLTTFTGGKSLFYQLLKIQDSYWYLFGILLGLFLSSIFLTWHFMTSKERGKTLKEMIGSWILFLTTIYTYSLCSPAILVCLVVIQQVMANIIMSVYFKPQSNHVEELSSELVKVHSLDPNKKPLTFPKEETTSEPIGALSLNPIKEK